MKNSLLVVTVVFGSAFSTACHPDLSIKKEWSEWTTETKTVGVEIKNEGRWRALKGPVRFECETSGKLITIEIPADDNKLIMPGKSTGALVDFQPFASADNNCLNDVQSVKVTVSKVPNERNFENNVKVVDVHAVHGQEEWLPPGTPSLAISMPFGTAKESRPITLHFSVASSGTDPRYPIVLRELSYQLKQEGEPQPFYSDNIVLFGAVAPTEFDVTPGVEYPQPGAHIIVEAQLTYGFDGTKSQELKTTAMFKPAWARETQAERMYERYLDGLVRRHIVASGRELGISWLKEYEPGKDRKELLWHSRTIRAGTDKEAPRTRVYIPWTSSKCEQPGCGRTVTDGAVVAMGGDENALLKSGLIMAVFANEYLASRDASRLDHALTVLKFVEDSEWKDPTDNYAPTGFFLRSDWTGHPFDKDKGFGEYRYASTDDLSGLTLGLGTLNQALLVAGPQYSVARERLVALVDRMGRQLRDTSYVIAPLRKRGGSLHDMGLPYRVDGTSIGTVPLRWFFAQGFEAITGQNYEVRSLSGALDMLRSLIPTDINMNILKMVEEIVDLDPLESAILTIQGMGIFLYHRSPATDWTIPLPCLPDVKTVASSKFEEFGRFNFPLLLHVYQFGMMNPSADIRKVQANLISPDTNPVEKGRLGKLLQDLLKRQRVQQEMARLVYGVLKPGGTQTELALYVLRNLESIALVMLGTASKPLFGSEMFVLGGLYGIGCQLLGNFSPTERVGTEAAENDAYAAAVAISTDLPSLLKDDSERHDFVALIHSALRGFIDEVSENLPLGDANGGVCFDVNNEKVMRDASGRTALSCNIKNGVDSCKSIGAASCANLEKAVGVDIVRHNPEQRKGAEFMWENQPENRVMGSPLGLAENRGISGATMLWNYENSPSIDSAQEGIGLDLLLPMSMLIRQNSRVKQLSAAEGQRMKYYLDVADVHRLMELHAVVDNRVPMLPVCVSNPVIAAAPAGSPQYRPCALRYPIVQPDAADARARNDRYAEATVISDWGIPMRFNLDRVSTRKAPGTSDLLYPGVTMISDRGGQMQEVLAEQDYDFFRFRPKRNMLLTITPASSDPLTVVMDDFPRKARTLTLSASTEHMVMVTGRSGEYTIDIRPAAWKIVGRLEGSSGTLDVSLTQTPGHNTYTGQIEFRRDASLVVVTHVERLYGNQTSMTFEGHGTLRGVAGHNFIITVSEDCPRFLSIDAKAPDGKVEHVVTRAAISEGILTFTDKEEPCEPDCPQCGPGYVWKDDRCVEAPPPCPGPCPPGAATISLKVQVPKNESAQTYQFRWVGRLKNAEPIGTAKWEFSKLASYPVGPQPECVGQGNISCMIVGERFDNLIPGEWEIGVWDKEGYMMWANTFVRVNANRVTDIKCDKRTQSCTSVESAQ